MTLDDAGRVALTLAKLEAAFSQISALGALDDHEQTLLAEAQTCLARSFVALRAYRDGRRPGVAG